MRGSRLLQGYWEDWCNEDEDVSWWEDDPPGHCRGGCVIQHGFVRKAAKFSTLSYAFSTLLKQPKPDQDDCHGGGNKCPLWNGDAIYREKDTSITSASTPDKPSATVVSISEFCRLARQFPTGPKRCLIGLGGWSDWARLGSVANAQKLAKLAAKLVLHSLADGVDLDFEHLAEYTRVYGEGEVAAFVALANELRAQLDAISPALWNETVTARLGALPKASDNSFGKANRVYLPEVARNGPPRFELVPHAAVYTPLHILHASAHHDDRPCMQVYTTRFNAFRNPAAPFDWETHQTPASYITDDEGAQVWPNTSSSFDTVNIMSYDQDPGMTLDFARILTNFHVHGGVPMEKLNIGFEPGEQGGGGTWEGQAADLNATAFVNGGPWGGAMVWGVNPDKGDQPHAYKIQAGFVDAVSAELDYPSWPWGTPPVYTPLAASGIA